MFHDSRNNNILIPAELDEKKQVTGFFVLNIQNIPEEGQKNLIDITGMPSRPGGKSYPVYHGPILPALQESYTKALIMLARSIDRCDASAHSQHTSIWAERVAASAGLDEMEVKQIKLAGLLHDIGKAVVSQEILTKPGPLSNQEWEIIKKHPGYGEKLMEPSPGLEAIRPIVRGHHEHYNGQGYPDGLVGEQIPLGARILSIADAYSTMTSKRSYRSPISLHAAINEFIRCSGTQFDPYLAGIMVNLLQESTK